MTKKTFIAIISVIFIAIVLNIPVATRQGINFKVRTLEIPLYIKVIEFVDRDHHYRRLVREITENQSTSEAKTIAILDWVKENIRDVPEGFDIIDDHVLDIIIRRYGSSDQMTDVFTTLCAYSRVPALRSLLKLTTGDENMPIAYVKLKGKWRVFDVHHNAYFLNREGEIASVEDIISDVSIVKAKGIKTKGVAYEEFFRDLEPIEKDFISKEQKQMPLYRIVYEVKSLFGKRS